MKLRSGKVYDAEYPYFLKNFMRFDNPLFGPIWDESAKIYNNHMNNDFFDAEKTKEARILFREHLYGEIRKIYNASR